MPLTPAFDFPAGEILLIDKPHGWTSFDVVNKIRYAVRTRGTQIKVGHAGTLDPLATGLLIIATGKATKRIEEFRNLDKEYNGTFRLGQTTPSHDGETEVQAEFDLTGVSEEVIRSCAKQFVGDITQVPPAHSAVQVKGKKSYVLARKGTPVELEPRRVRIDEFVITDVALPEVHFRVRCSKGTYIRSLANDFGKALNNGAWLSALCRTRIGDYSLNEAYGLDEFIALVESNKQR
jgi:tRNA pseudouridine55 synthase